MTAETPTQPDQGLLPCPLCGEPAKIVYFDPRDGPDGIASISCSMCRVTIGNWLDGTEAIAAWNHRIACAPKVEGE